MVIGSKDFKGLNRSMAIWLVIAVAFISLVDSPEGLENALQHKYRIDVNWSVAANKPAGVISTESIGTFSDSARRKSAYFDEDYIIIWLSSLRFRPALAKIAGDASTVKYRSFYGLGNISPRHLLLSMYRDFVNLNIQQYGCSIH